MAGVIWGYLESRDDLEREAEREKPARAAARVAAGTGVIHIDDAALSSMFHWTGGYHMNVGDLVNIGAMRTLSAVLLAGALAAVAATPSRADGSVSALGMGLGARPGEMGRFDAVVSQYNASGERFRIDGHCQSACTIFLSIRNVCITPNATLLFHAGGDPRTGRMNPASTAHMLAAYKAALRQYVSEHYFMATFAFHSISGRDMVRLFGYPACR